MELLRNLFYSVISFTCLLVSCFPVIFFKTIFNRHHLFPLCACNTLINPNNHLSNFTNFHRKFLWILLCSLEIANCILLLFLVNNFIMSLLKPFYCLKDKKDKLAAVDFFYNNIHQNFLYSSIYRSISPNLS